MIEKRETVRLFVSSTFDDLKAERNALQEQVFPRLRDYCISRGWRFQAIDLRWGVSEEANCDQRTMRICLEEIDRCQHISPRPNFIVLMGDRYGWCPIPEEIPADKFEQIEKRVTESEALLMREWYFRDDNNVPPVYCLQPRIDEYVDYSVWQKDVEEPLGSAFRNAVDGLKLSPQARVKYEGSALEQEIQAGALQVPDAHEHVFAFYREIQDIPDDASTKDFQDFTAAGRLDRRLQDRLRSLKARLTKHLKGNVCTYAARWTGSGPSTDHLDQLCEDVYDRLLGVIQQEIEEAESRDSLKDEIVHQDAFGSDRSKFFTGREEILERIIDYVKEDSRHPLVIHGESGVGKTTLMDRASDLAHDACPHANLVVRFIGATPESSNGRSLLESLCRQIRAVYGKDTSDTPQDYQSLVGEFSQCLALATRDDPLLVFIDALDQLSDTDNARSLVWLPRELPEHVYFVVSTLPNECHKALKRTLPASTFLRLQPMSAEQGETLLDQWLKDAGRTLQPVQHREIFNKFKKTGLPFYLKLAFEEVRLWHSYDRVPEYDGRPGLADTVQGIIGNLFWRLSQEKNHGAHLVSRALGYLRCGRNGLAQEEITDALALDDNYWEHFLDDAQHVLPQEKSEGRRLPFIIWSRLYHDLEPYLTERESDGTSLLDFYHRQLGEAVDRAFLFEQTKKELHAGLADYFQAQALYGDHESEKRANRRKLSELPYQLASARLWKDFESTLSSYAFLQAKVDTTGPEPLIDDYGLWRHERDAGLDLIRGSIRLSAHVLARAPEQLVAQLHGRLAGHEDSNVRLLLDEARPQTAYWLRPLKPYLDAPDGLLLRTLQGHTNSVDAVVVTTDGRVLSASSDTDLRIWDLDTGKCTHVLEGHSYGVTAVAVTANGQAVSASNDFDDKTLRVWDLDTGKCKHVLEGHGDGVTAVAVTPDNLAISAAWDKTLRVWDLATGKCTRVLEGHTNRVTAVAVTSDARAVSASEDSTLRLWNLGTGRCERVLEGHPYGVTAVAVTADGRAVSTSWDGTLRVWNLDTGECVHVIEGPSYGVTAVTENGRAVSASNDVDDKSLCVWDLDTGKCVHVLEGHSGRVTALAVSADGRAVTAAGDEVRVWNLDTGKCIHVSRGHTYRVSAVAATADGRAVAAARDGTLRVWDLDPAECVHLSEKYTVSEMLTAIYYGRPKALAYVARDIGSITAVVLTTGGRAVSVARYGTIRVWDLDTGNCVHVLEEGYHVDVTAHDRAVSAFKDSTIRVWDLDTGKCVRVLEGHKAGVTALAMSADGRAISASADSSLRVWDLDTGKCVHVLEGPTGIVTGVALTSDGRAVSIGDGTDGIVHEWSLGRGATNKTFGVDYTIRIWDLDTGKCVRVLEGHTCEVSAVAVTPGGRVVSVARYGTIRVWDLDTGKCLHVLEGRTHGVTADGRAVVSAWDGTIRVWDLDRGECTHVLVEGHSCGNPAVAVIADGRLYASWWDGTLRVWDLDTGYCVHVMEIPLGCITAVAATVQDGCTIIVGTESGGVHILRLEKGRDGSTRTQKSIDTRKV